MKVETNHTKEFKPIELKITIESKAELEALLIITGDVNDEMIKRICSLPGADTSLINPSLFFELYEKLEQLYK